MSENKETKYNSCIAPKVEEIRQICNTNQIPCFMAFGVGQEKDGRYKMRGTAMVPALYGQDSRKDNRWADFINVQNGFRTIPPETPHTESVDMEEFALPEGMLGLGARDPNMDEYISTKTDEYLSSKK